MAAEPDPFRIYRERLDPRVASDLGFQVAKLGPSAAIQSEDALRTWAGSATAKDLDLLERMDKRVSGWAEENSDAAGIAIATWKQLPHLTRDDWFDDYRPVLGARIAWDVKGRAALHASQPAAPSNATAVAVAEDRAKDTDYGLVPAVFTDLDPEREAMERAARRVVALRELRSRAVGVTVDPKLIPVGLEPPVEDAEFAMRRCRDRLAPLAGLRRRIEYNAEACIGSLNVSDRNSMHALQEKFETAMPGASAVASEGHFQVPAAVRESLKLARGQAISAEHHLRAMTWAGEARRSGGSQLDSGRQDGRYSYSTEEAAGHWRIVERIEAKLDQYRAQGQDAGIWLASNECDWQTRGFAAHAVRNELALEQGRRSEIEGPDAGNGFEM